MYRLDHFQQIVYEFGMAIIQQLPVLCLTNFGEISEYVLKQITSHSSKVIYFVTDQYLENSLKKNGVSGQHSYSNKGRDQKPPKQFKKYLSDGTNKTDLVKFLLNDWSETQRLKTPIADRVLILTLESKAYRLQVVNNQVTSSTEENFFFD